MKPVVSSAESVDNIKPVFSHGGPRLRLLPWQGSRVTFQGKPAVIAAEVKKGDEVLKLRDETGLPAWSA